MSDNKAHSEKTLQERASAVERALVQGDLSGLTEPERLSYYRQVCETLGLNPLTKPFDYIVLNKKLTLYAKKDCAEQLRRNHNISLAIVARQESQGIYEVTARATLPGGRADEDTGAVNVQGLQGADLANARMKAVTKAKRRVTLSICGLGFLDESEIGSISAAEAIPEASSAPQIEHRQELPPADGAELAAFVKRREEKLAAEKRCAPGEMLAFVVQQGLALGFPQEIARWPAEAIKRAGGWMRTFLALHPAPQAQPAANGESAPAPQAAAAPAGFVTPEKAKELHELMHRKGRHWARKEKGDAGASVCHVFELPETTMIEDLSPFQYAEIRKALSEERDFVRA